MSVTAQAMLDARPDQPPSDVARELAEPLPKLHLADLRTGDVLLSRGIGRLSDVIAGIDNGRYSHAAIFDGKSFVQATLKGIVASEPKVMYEHQWYLDVFRFHTQDGGELDNKGPPSAPIVNQVQSFIGNGYAYDELALAAMLFVLRKVNAVPYMGKLLEIIGGMGMSGLREFFRKYILGKKTRTMICTEVVVRGFWQASDKRGDPYGLHLDIKHRHGELMAPHFSAEESSQYDQMVAEIKEAFDEVDPEVAAQWDVAQAPPLQGSNGLAAIAGSPIFPAGCISPHDLQSSFSLTRIGRYDDWLKE